MTATSPLSRREAERLVAKAVDSGRLERTHAEKLAAELLSPAVFEPLLEGAFESKRRGKGLAVSVSRNVFIPLTNLCRDRCAYCTFAKQPDDPAAKTYTLGEVAQVVRDGLRAGCVEALFCLGDKPEIAYKTYREWLAARGLKNTAEYLTQACEVGFAEGMLPHSNAGILSADEMGELKRSNASLGLMLESTSPRLRETGMAHYYCPDKEPAVRLRMHEEAGEQRIPFTTGILLGIGETPAERVDTLLAIRELADRVGHIQEVIVQPFHAKHDTPMRDVPSLSNDEIARWVAAGAAGARPADERAGAAEPGARSARAAAALGLERLGRHLAGHRDFINPEAPWPKTRRAAAAHRGVGTAAGRAAARLPGIPGAPRVLRGARARRMSGARWRGWIRPAGPTRTDGDAVEAA